MVKNPTKNIRKISWKSKFTYKNISLYPSWMGKSFR